MSKPSGKGPDYVVEEDDFFGSHIQKKIRKFKKKLKEIEELEAKPEEELNPSQREKIASREEQEEGIRAAEELLKAYITAFVDALGESTEPPKVHVVPGKKEQKKLEKKAAAAKAQVAPEKPAEKPAEKKEEKPAATTTKAPEPAHKEIDAGKLRNILNLVHFAQFFGNTGAIEDYQKVEGSQDHLNEVYSFINDFYNKVFSYTEASKYSTNDDKINSSVHELEQYLSRSKAPALKNRSYADLFEIVEKVTATKHFHEKTADFDKHTGHKTETKSYQAAIGSEARGTTSHHKEAVAHKEAPAAPKEPAHTETHAPKPTQSSPTVHKEAPAPKEPEPTKEEEKPQQGRKAWHQVDSDEDEEAGEEAEEQAQPEEKAPEKTSPQKEERPQQQRNKGGRQWEEKPKPTGEPEVDEDGFIIVRSAKEKKEAQLAAERAARGNRRGGRGGPRGDRGGRGPRRGGPRPPREGHEGEEGHEGGEGGYRGGRGHWRPKTEGGEEGGRPWRGGRGGGDRPWRGRGGPRGGNEEGKEESAPAPTGGN